MKQFITRTVLLISLILWGAVIQAQDITPTEAPADDADLAITFPPPVWIVSDSVDIIGTVDIAGMSNYLIEYQMFAFGDDAEDDAPWFPATLPGGRPVSNGLLGTWNTTTVRDGLYKIRLTVLLENSDFEYFEVSPLRVENDAEDGLAFALDTLVTATPTVTVRDQSSSPTLQATPTNTGGRSIVTGPRVTAITNANVRSGDSTTYGTVGALREGETAAVLGISAVRNGWYYIELSNGRRGFIAPSTVEFAGEASELRLVRPPATPTPIPTATPVTTANLQVTGMEIIPNPPVCANTFEIRINVNNSGSGATSSSGTLTVVDTHNRTGTQTASTVGGFPVLNSGGNFVVVANLTVNTYFNEAHTLRVFVDNNGQIPETNEGDNGYAITYTLQPGGC